MEGKKLSQKNGQCQAELGLKLKCDSYKYIQMSVCVCAGSGCANFFPTFCEDRGVPGLEQLLDGYMVWGWLQTEGSCFGNLQAENVFSWHPFLPEGFWAISIFPQIPEHSLWAPSLTCPLQIHNEYEINRKQLKVNHSLIINKTVPDRGHISTNHKKKGGRVAQSLYLILTTLCFFIWVLRKIAPHSRVLYELNPKSIFLDYMDACLTGAEREMRDFGAMVTHARWMPNQQDRLFGAW